MAAVDPVARLNRTREQLKSALAVTKSSFAKWHPFCQQVVKLCSSPAGTNAGLETSIRETHAICKAAAHKVQQALQSSVDKLDSVLKLAAKGTNTSEFASALESFDEFMDEAADSAIAVMRECEQQRIGKLLGEHVFQNAEAMAQMALSFVAFETAPSSYSSAVSSTTTSISLAAASGAGVAPAASSAQGPELWMALFKKREQSQLTSLRALAAQVREAAVEFLKEDGRLWGMLRHLQPISLVASAMTEVCERAPSQTDSFLDLETALVHRAESMKALLTNVQSAQTTGKQLASSLETYMKHASKEAKAAESLPSLAQDVERATEWIGLCERVVDFGSSDNLVSDLVSFDEIAAKMQLFANKSNMKIKGCSVIRTAAARFEAIVKEYTTWQSCRETCRLYDEEKNSLDSLVQSHQEWVAQGLQTARSFYSSLAGLLQATREASVADNLAELNVSTSHVGDLRKSLDNYSSLLDQHQKRNKIVQKASTAFELFTQKAAAARTQMLAIQDSFGALCKSLEPTVAQLKALEKTLQLADAVVEAHVRQVFEFDRPKALGLLENQQWEEAALLEAAVDESTQHAASQLQGLGFDRRAAEFGSTSKSLYDDVQDLLKMRVRSVPLRESLLNKRDAHSQTSDRLVEEWKTVLADEDDLLMRARRKVCEMFLELCEDVQDALDDIRVSPLPVVSSAQKKSPQALSGGQVVASAAGISLERRDSDGRRASSDGYGGPAGEASATAAVDDSDEASSIPSSSFDETA